ncbi:hypothetical protein WJ64_25040 [Burkholderia ubonensis]|nr:hypothetical protein WJ64_25040 [Burkholderia ubonensis]
MRLGHTCPDLGARLLSEPDEWRAVYILNRKPLPNTVPRLNAVERLVAKQGGLLARNGDGNSCAKAIWQGMQRVMDFAAGIRYARELDHPTCV